MKKTISINIGGNIFHIEEEGYEKLKNYLDSVHRFFADFEDSKEIIDDIERRIAEKFYSQLKKNKEAVSAAEVDDLIASMGTVADFEATLDEEPSDQKQKDSKKDDQSTVSSVAQGEGKRLYRDTKRGLISGVSAGIAHYFSVDAIWIRLLWILLISAYGIGFLAYIVLWIVLPGNDQLEDEPQVKKLYRNPDEKVLGGVCGGLASYFGTDPAVIRLIFVLSVLFFGTGLILYIILWIITPLAETVTQKMEMKGQPVTLSGIERNVKKSLKIDQEEESLLVKVLLFPFRLIAMIFEGLGRMAGPLATFFVELIRIVFGSALILAAFTGMIAQIAGLSVLLGAPGTVIINGHSDPLPMQILLEQVGPLTSISLFLLGFIPLLGIALLGLVIVLKRRIGNAYVAVTLVGLWLLGLLGATFTVPGIVNQYRSQSEISREYVFEADTTRVPLIGINYAGYESYGRADLRLRGHEDTTYLVLVDIESRGYSRNQAEEMADKVQYNVSETTEGFIFDSNLSLEDDGDFRFQDVSATMYLPFGQTFRMTDELRDILRNTINRSGYSAYQMEDNDWVFEENEGLICLTCEEEPRRKRDRTDIEPKGRRYSYDDFDEIEIDAGFDVYIYQSPTHEVRMDGSRRAMRRVEIDTRRDRLVLDSEGWWKSRDRVRVYIGTPELEYLSLGGSCHAQLDGFDAEDLEFELTGSSELNANLGFVKQVEGRVFGGAEVILTGRGEDLDVEASGAGSFDAKDFLTQDATVRAVGASNVWVQASERLDVTASGASDVYYYGDPRIKQDISGSSDLTKRD